MSLYDEAFYSNYVTLTHVSDSLTLLFKTTLNEGVRAVVVVVAGGALVCNNLSGVGGRGPIFAALLGLPRDCVNAPQTHCRTTARVHCVLPLLRRAGPNHQADNEAWYVVVYPPSRFRPVCACLLSVRVCTREEADLGEANVVVQFGGVLVFSRVPMQVVVRSVCSRCSALSHERPRVQHPPVRLTSLATKSSWWVPNMVRCCWCCLSVMSHPCVQGHRRSASLLERLIAKLLARRPSCKRGDVSAHVYMGSRWRAS